jgi:type IV secretion system protein VirD4
MSLAHNQQYRYGSAALADEFAVRKSGLFEPRGLPIGFYGNRRLWIDGDAPLITFGGAGSGKLTTKIGHIMCLVKDRSMMILDPRGEIAATFMAALAHNGIEAFLWNPYGLHGLPRHRFNPLDHIRPESQNFHADCKMTAQSLTPVTTTGNGRYFQQRASNWVESLIKRICELEGHVSLPMLMDVLNMVETDGSGWPEYLERMMSSAFPDVRRTAGELLSKQTSAHNEFGGIVGEIYGSLSCLDDPVLRASLDGSDFSLAELCASDRPRFVFIMIPAEYLIQVGAVLRLVIANLLIYKARSPSSPSVLALMDEAAQLGPFKMLEQLNTYARGFKLQVSTYWQGVGQTRANFTDAGAEAFIGSAHVRDFVGVRDYKTAQLVSDMLGTETLEYDDERIQEAARRQKVQALQRMMAGEDAFAAMLDVAHFKKAAELPTKQPRKVRTADEILAMQGSRQIMFVGGDEPLAIEATKRPYFKCPELAGLYLPNPYHPPHDKVRIATWWGWKWARVIREPVPKKFESYAQYQDGTWAYVEGYKPT